MPRPGPRPYECVRRAWHSDRHHPMRGSLIQDIFRLVNEVHSSATKKNKEWQEKLPVVVLKAEEIMYSKANSEAEYLDIKTLWDRTNDAINTIIRRDESTETGELLQPCIEGCHYVLHFDHGYCKCMITPEASRKCGCFCVMNFLAFEHFSAALNLGCTPRRASRSQRNSNPPRCYLSPGEDPNNTTPAMIHGSIQTNDPRNLQFIANYPNLINPTISNLIQLASEPQNLVPQKSHNVTSDKSPYVAYNNSNQFLCIENYPGSSLCCVYPLYYGGCPGTQHCFGTTTKSFLGELEPIKGGISENLFSCNVNVPADGQKDLRYDHLNQHEVSCDLSLRLGSLSTPFSCKENIQCHDAADGFSQERCKLNDKKQKVDKDVSFTNVNVDDPLHCPSKLNQQTR